MLDVLWSNQSSRFIAIYRRNLNALEIAVAFIKCVCVFKKANSSNKLKVD